MMTNEMLGEQLLNSAVFAKELFLCTKTSIAILNSKHELVALNQSFYEFFGFTSTEECRENYSDRFVNRNSDGEYDYTTLNAKLDEVYQVGSGVIEWNCYNHNKEIIPVSLYTYRLNIEDNTGGNIIAVILRDARPDIALQEKNEGLFYKYLKAVLDTCPWSVNLWTTEFENILFNKKALELYNVSDNSMTLEKFFELSPKYQPNGRLSSELAKENFSKAVQEGSYTFNWLHKVVGGEEIPCEVTLVKTMPFGKVESELIVAFIKDLRDFVAGNAPDMTINTYFKDIISDKVLFNSLTNLVNDLIFTFDLRTSRIRYYGKGYEQFTQNSETDIKTLAESTAIYKDDRAILEKVIKNMYEGIVEPTEFRLVNNEGVVRYHKFDYEILKDSQGKPIVVVGKSADIDDQKSFEEQAKMDLLANCFNKVTAQREMEKILAQSNSESQHALFIVDIDDFKNVNDTLGHQFGDMVIADVGKKIKSCFRSHDVVGRLGGDEFIVLLKDVKELNVILEKAERLVNFFRTTYSGNNNDYKISGSVGVARFPLNGGNYQELYDAADKALYQSKKKGKDCYTFYSSEFDQGTMKNLTILENASRSANSYFEANFISMVFNLLHETKDINTTINLVLKILGEHFKVDRSYIFESLDTGATYDNTFEWCAEGIGAEIDNLKGLTAEILEDFFRDASDDGIFFSNDLRVLEADGAFELMKNQGILSFLHSQVYRDGYVSLFLGFDDCTKPRIWTEKEVNTIKYIAKLLSTFLLLEHTRKGRM